MGRKGQKTGAGWYRYENGDRTPHPDPEVHRIIREVAAEQGIEQRSFTDEEMLQRLLFGSVNEACKMLEEGKALRASDIDVMWLNGFGFPRYRGGLMFWADGIGARAIYNQIAAWHQRYGARWAPAPLLRQVAEQGGQFRDLKAPKLRLVFNEGKRTMDLRFTPEETAFREEVRAFIRDNLPAETASACGSAIRPRKQDTIAWMRILNAQGLGGLRLAEGIRRPGLDRDPADDLPRGEPRRRRRRCSPSTSPCSARC